MAIKGIRMTMNEYCQQKVSKNWYEATDELGNIYFRWQEDSPIVYLCAETGGTFNLDGTEEDDSGMTLSANIWVIGISLSKIHIGGE